MSPDVPLTWGNNADVFSFFLLFCIFFKFSTISMDSIYDRKQKQSFDYKISGEGMNGAISTVFSFFKNSGISSAFLGLYLGKTLHIHEWWKEAGSLCRT